VKRKLIKRNKQFLSGRYKHSLNGEGSFQRLTQVSCYFDNDDNITFKRRRHTWVWFYKAGFIEVLFKDIDTEEFMDNLAEISAIDQELVLY